MQAAGHGRGGLVGIAHVIGGGAFRGDGGGAAGEGMPDGSLDGGAAPDPQEPPPPSCLDRGLQCRYDLASVDVLSQVHVPLGHDDRTVASEPADRLDRHTLLGQPRTGRVAEVV